jgi:hypothetical protein
MLKSVSGYENFQYEVRMHSTDETARRKLQDLICFAENEDDRLKFDFNYTALNDRRDNLHDNAPVAPSPKTDPVTLHDVASTYAPKLSEQARHYLRLNLSDPNFRGGNFNRQRALEKVCSRVHLRTDDAGETLKWFRSTDCSDFDPDLAGFTSFENNDFWPQFEEVLPQESMLVLHCTHRQISRVLRIDPKTFLQQMNQECSNNYSIRIQLNENRVTVFHRNGKLFRFAGDEQGETSEKLTERLTGIDPPFALQYQLITWRYKDRVDETIIKHDFGKKFDEFGKDIRQWQSSLKPLP